MRRPAPVRAGHRPGPGRRDPGRPPPMPVRSSASPGHDHVRQQCRARGESGPCRAVPGEEGDRRGRELGPHVVQCVVEGVAGQVQHQFLQPGVVADEQQRPHLVGCLAHHVEQLRHIGRVQPRVVAVRAAACPTARRPAPRSGAPVRRWSTRRGRAGSPPRRGPARRRGRRGGRGVPGAVRGRVRPRARPTWRAAGRPVCAAGPLRRARSCRGSDLTGEFQTEEPVRVGVRLEAGAVRYVRAPSTSRSTSSTAGTSRSSSQAARRAWRTCRGPASTAASPRPPTAWRQRSSVWAASARAVASSGHGGPAGVAEESEPKGGARRGRLLASRHGGDLDRDLGGRSGRRRRRRPPTVIAARRPSDRPRAAPAALPSSRPASIGRMPRSSARSRSAAGGSRDEEDAGVPPISRARARTSATSRTRRAEVSSPGTWASTRVSALRDARRARRSGRR